MTRLILTFSMILLISTLISADITPHRTKVRFMAVGDMQLGQGVGPRIKQNGSPWLFEKVMPIISQADLLFGNLECPLSTHDEPAQKRYVFRGDPALAHELKSHGFDALSVANNHAYDHGKTALGDTLRNLKAAGITSVGGGFGNDEPYKPKIVEVNNMKIAFLGAQNIGWYGTSDGVPGIAMINEKRLIEEIKNIRNKSDFIIVSLHWGIEYTDNPLDTQKELAHKLMDNGADIIIGHHPHVLQGIERYKNGYIAYSLGNFIFNNDDDLACRTIILTFDLYPNGTISNPMIAPVKIKGFRPELDYTSDCEKTINRLIKCGKNLGKNGIIKFYYLAPPEYINHEN